MQFAQKLHATIEAIKYKQKYNWEATSSEGMKKSRFPFGSNSRATDVPLPPSPW